MEFEKIIETRQSTRKFSGKVPSDEVIEKILDAGRRAPSAKNMQPARFYVLKSEAALRAVDKASPCRYGAPAVIMVCVDKNEVFASATHSTAEIDGSIAATHIILAATNEGVDNIWVELFDRDIIKGELGIADNILPICLIPVGYRADDCPVSRNFHNRKPLEEIFEYI